MDLRYEKELANDLERGLGDVHWMAAAYDKSLRLRVPVCGLTSTALVEAFRSAGVSAEPIISSPKDLITEPDSQHVFVRIETENGPYIVDPTYSQFLDKVGLSAGYVTFGGKNLYPERKIAVFKFDDGEKIAQDLATATLYFREHREELDEYMGTYAMDEMPFDELVNEFSKIWNPDYFDAFITCESETIKAGSRLAQYILPKHIEFVN